MLREINNLDTHKAGDAKIKNIMIKFGKVKVRDNRKKWNNLEKFNHLHYQENYTSKTEMACPNSKVDSLNAFIVGLEQSSGLLPMKSGADSLRVILRHFDLPRRVMTPLFGNSRI